MNPRPIIITSIIAVLFVAAVYFGWKWGFESGRIDDSKSTEESLAHVIKEREALLKQIRQRITKIEADESEELEWLNEHEKITAAGLRVLKAWKQHLAEAAPILKAWQEDFNMINVERAYREMEERIKREAGEDNNMHLEPNTPKKENGE
jgi:hypothetical protein